jgi:hypothetical protein
MKTIVVGLMLTVFATGAQAKQDAVGRAEASKHALCDALYHDHADQLASCLNPPPPPPLPTDQEWTAQDIEPMGWQALTSSRGVYVLVRDKMAGTSPRLWARWEYKSPASSAVELLEFDCKGKRQRTIQSSRYSGQNLLGPISTTQASSAIWVYETPGTLGETILEYACNPKSADEEFDKFFSDTLGSKR